MKRFLLPMILSGLLALLLFQAACTPQPAETETAPTASATPHPSATPRPTATAIPTPTIASYLTIGTEELQGVTLRFWHPFTNDAAAQLRGMVNDFNTENPYGITVEVYSLGAGSVLQERMESELAREDEEAQLPHVVAGANLLLQSWQDVLQPVDEYLDHPDWGLTRTDLAGFDALSLAQGVTPDGARISLPILRNAPVLYFNRTWAEELGFVVDVDNPAGFDFADFSAIACAAQQALLADNDMDNNGTGGWVISMNESSILSWLRAYGYTDFTPADGRFHFDTPAAQTAFGDLWNLTSQGCAWISRQPTPYDYFATRRAVFFSGTLRDVDLVQRALDLAGSTDQWMILPYPGPEGSSALLWDSSGISLLKGTPQEQLAGWLFIDWLLESRQLALLSISTHSLPVREDSQPWMQVYLDKYPQWAATASWDMAAQSMPLHPNWMCAGNILEDAAWQVFQPYTTVEEIPDILAQLDAMIAEYSVP